MLGTDAADAGVAAVLPLSPDPAAGAAASAEGDDERTSLLPARRKRVLLAVAVSSGDADLLDSRLRATAVGLSNCAPLGSSADASESVVTFFRNRERGAGAAPLPGESPCSGIGAAMDNALGATAPVAAAQVGLAGADTSTVTDRKRDFPFLRTLGAAALPSAPRDDGARDEIVVGRPLGAAAGPCETAGAVPARARRGARLERLPPLTDDSSLLARFGGARERGASGLSRNLLADGGTAAAAESPNPSVAADEVTVLKTVFLLVAISQIVLVWFFFLRQLSSAFFVFIALHRYGNATCRQLSSSSRRASSCS